MNDFLLRLMLTRDAGPARRALLGAACGAAAVAVRLMLYPLLGLGIPYISFFPMLLIASLLFDVAGGVACLAVTTLGAILILTQPATAQPGLARPLISLPFYVLSAAAMIWFAMMLRRALASLHAREQHERLLVGELQHRVKNTLSIVQSIAGQTLRASPDMESFKAAFTDRLAALGDAHNALSRSAWAPITVRDLLRQTLAPFVPLDGRRLRLDGEELLLAPDHVVSLAFCVHELATNATKYGAYSVPDGWVEISWSTTGDGPHRKRISVAWREHGGPPVKPPDRQGFGSRILAAGVGSRARARTTLEFWPEGLRWSVSFDAAMDEAGPADAG